jgi:hypothetical protein
LKELRVKAERNIKTSNITCVDCISVKMIRNNEYFTGYLGDESAVCSPAFVQDSDAFVMHRFEPADFKAPYRNRGRWGRGGSCEKGEGWRKWWRVDAE